MPETKSLVSYVRDAYREYRYNRQRSAALQLANDRLDKIRENGELLPADIEQIMTATSKFKRAKPVRVRLRKLWDIATRSISSDNVYHNTYDFERLSVIYEKEPFMMRAVSYYVETALRNTHKVVGQDPNFIDYILLRMKQWELVSEQDLRQFYRQALLSLLLFGNIIVSKRRNPKATSGRAYTRYDGKQLEPVAAYFVEDPRTMMIEKATNGQIKYRRISTSSVKKISYTYVLQGKTVYVPFGADVLDKDKIFNKEDIIHIKFHPLPGAVWGTPPFMGVADDLVTLRSIEECSELLVYQYGHPFLHAKIGTDNLPGKDEEVEEVRTEVERMEGNGMLVTSHRVAIENVTGKGSGVDLAPYLKYFKQRAFTGLNVDGNIMGEGETANKESSNIIDKIHGGFVVELQTHLKMMHTKVHTDFKYEYPLTIREFFLPRYEVNAEYQEVDTNSKIALENHYVNSFVQGGISRTELRAEMGRNAMTPEQEADTYNELVTVQNLEREAQIGMNELQLQNQNALQIARISASARRTTASGSKTTSASKKAKTKVGGASNKSKNKSRPSNQHGTKITPTPKKG